tara:strand:- start:223 stop:603 length:381 start_codon:yes stop_codon:yes gene_type:complete
MKNKKTNSRTFGILFSIIFFAFSFYPVTKGGNINVYLLVIGSIFLLLTIINSKILIPLEQLWIKFGELLGRIVSPIIMMVIFYFVILPTKILLVLFRKDILNLKLNKRKSYWIQRNEKKTNINEQF